MIAHDRLSKPSCPGEDSHLFKENVSVVSFMRDALEMLRHVSSTVKQRAEMDSLNDLDDTDDESEDPCRTDGNASDSVTWRLNLTPNMITLETNIQTLAGLEKVLEQLRLNVNQENMEVNGRRHRKAVCSNEFEMKSFQNAMSTLLGLGMMVRMSKPDVFRQFNSIQLMQLMQQCVDAFLTCEGAFFIDSAQLLKDTQKVLTHADAATEYPIKTLLVLSICCMMIRHVGFHNHLPPAVSLGLMRNYYGQARVLLEDLFDCHHISVVHALFILSLFPRGHADFFSPSRTRSPLLQTALRMALAMNLHRIDVSGHAPGNVNEYRRRFSWMLLCADYFAESNAVGTTGWIAPTEWYVNFPDSLPGEHNASRIQAFSYFCRVVMIRKMHFFRSTYMISLRSTKALADGLDNYIFNTLLDDGYSHLRLDPNKISGWSKSDLECLLINSFHCNTSLIARLPFLPRDYLDSVQREAPERDRDIREIHQRLFHSTQSPPFIPFMHSNPSPSSSSSLSSSSTRVLMKNNPERTTHCILSCLEISNRYTLLLEALVSVDPSGCHQSPVYGLLMTALVYRIFIASNQDTDIARVSQINLIRTLRLVERCKSVYGDAVLYYLEQVIPRWVVVPLEEPNEALVFKATQIINGLKSRLNQDLMANFREKSEETQVSQESDIKPEKF